MFKKRRNLLQLCIEKCFRLLKIYFLIHGIGLDIKSKKTSQARKIISIFLGVFIETNSWLYFFIAYFKDDFSNSRNKTRMISNLTFHSLDLMQRIWFFNTDRKLMNLVNKIIKIYSQMPNNDIKKLKIFLLVFIFISDALRFAAFICVSIFISNDPLFHKIKIFNTNITYPVICIQVTYFCVIWRKTAPCAAIYLYSLCYFLKSILNRIHQLGTHDYLRVNLLIMPYNKTVDVTKELNDTLQFMLFSTLAISLGSVFYEGFNLMTAENAFLYLFARIFRLLLSFFTFVGTCLSASFVIIVGKNTRRVLQKLKNVQIKTEKKQYDLYVDDDFLGFVIFDSIVIDKNFILSSFGVLLTYGVMIATFNQTK